MLPQQQCIRAGEVEPKCFSIQQSGNLEFCHSCRPDETTTVEIRPAVYV